MFEISPAYRPRKGFTTLPVGNRLLRNADLSGYLRLREFALLFKGKAVFLLPLLVFLINRQAQGKLLREAMCPDLPAGFCRAVDLVRQGDELVARLQFGHGFSLQSSLGAHEH